MACGLLRWSIFRSPFFRAGRSSRPCLRVSSVFHSWSTLASATRALCVSMVSPLSSLYHGCGSRQRGGRRQAVLGEGNGGRKGCKVKGWWVRGLGTWGMRYEVSVEAWRAVPNKTSPSTASLQWPRESASMSGAQHSPTYDWTLVHDVQPPHSYRSSNPVTIQHLQPNGVLSPAGCCVPAVVQPACYCFFDPACHA